MYVPVHAQAAVDEIDDARGNGETQAFTASALRQDKGVDAENRAVHIHERASAVAGVDGRVGLNVGERLGRDRPGGRAALTTPIVTEFCRPSGLPMANTSWPTLRPLLADEAEASADRFRQS